MTTTHLPQAKSAFELYTRDINRNSIITFNEGIDSMLGGGVPIGKITEFCKYYLADRYIIIANYS